MTRLFMWVIGSVRASWRSFWAAKLDGWSELMDEARDTYSERRRIRSLEIRTAARRPLVPEKWLK